ncbi:type II toxin-antitoxin system RelE/ParE family toxin [Rufibacter quisquiliarum]|uniref:Proteic killer suppression protein n=1 Tax=Rufibacter quisquiliarum TaxID=1549639 RepID=A0A839GMA5_9BACT|nr:type II toxin-antitoxin system RelE/ParE family toxin [Rufibacter quisquiliarum]MBA9076106.1 proteic killer suppression protein [Rufibacter quisquiliarum]
MEIIFNDDELCSLYEGKKIKNKEYQSNPQLVKQFIKTVKLMQSVSRVEQLTQFYTLNYHKLGGKLDGLSTVYVNKQYRILFTEVPEEEPPHIVRIVKIEELSKHYQ